MYLVTIALESWERWAKYPKTTPLKPPSYFFPWTRQLQSFTWHIKLSGVPPQKWTQHPWKTPFWPLALKTTSWVQILQLYQNVGTYSHCIVTFEGFDGFSSARGQNRGFQGCWVHYWGFQDQKFRFWSILGCFGAFSEKQLPWTYTLERRSM